MEILASQGRPLTTTNPLRLDVLLDGGFIETATDKTLDVEEGVDKVHEYLRANCESVNKTNLCKETENDSELQRLKSKPKFKSGSITKEFVTRGLKFNFRERTRVRRLNGFPQAQSQEQGPGRSKGRVGLGL